MKNILRMSEAPRSLGISKSMIYNKLNSASCYYDPDFPKPLSLSVKTRGFIQSNLDEYLMSLTEKDKGGAEPENN